MNKQADSLISTECPPLPDTFLNIRLSPVEIVDQSPEDIKKIIHEQVCDAGNPKLTGICCVNMDEQVSEAQVIAICEAARELRKEFEKGSIQ